MDAIIQLFFSGLSVGAIYALIALGFVTIYNVTGVLNFAQGEFAMVAALSMVSLTKMGLNFLPAFVISVLVATLLGAALERFAVHPARGAKAELTLIMITLGADIVIRGVGLLIWDSEPKVLPPFSPGDPVSFLGAQIQRQSFWIISVSLVMVFLMYLFFNRSLLGKALRACSMNRIASRLMGIRPERMSLLAFSLSAGMTGIAGITIAPVTLATYDMGLMLGVKGFVAAVLGGLTNPTAAIAGGFLLGVIESEGSGLFASGYKDAISFGVLILVLFFKPNGLLGMLSSKRV